MQHPDEPDAQERLWMCELRDCITSLEQLEKVLPLTASEREGIELRAKAGLPLSITPSYFRLIDPRDPRCPIRLQCVPSAEEAIEVAGDLVDPLGEKAHEVAPDLVSRYPDRALLLVSDRCSVYCRFCTRSRMVGGGAPLEGVDGPTKLPMSQASGVRSLAYLAPAFAWLLQHPEIRDVIVSGGDPLVMSTERLCAILERLRAIPSVETIRLATRAPVTLPSRITPGLLGALRPFHPIWVMTHFNHPRELSPESERACRLLADAGFPVNNQTVLLRGVNDDADTLERLFRGLVRNRVRPYYLLQADPVRGTSHLRTPIEVGIEIMRTLQGRLSGIALPKLIVDTPGGMGKVPIGPDFIVSRSPGATTLRTHRGVDVTYYDPPTRPAPHVEL